MYFPFIKTSSIRKILVLTFSKKNFCKSLRDFARHYSFLVKIIFFLACNRVFWALKLEITRVPENCILQMKDKGVWRGRCDIKYFSVGCIGQNWKLNTSNCYKLNRQSLNWGPLSLFGKIFIYNYKIILFPVCTMPKAIWALWKCS